jgi:hypothetical protein
MLMGRSSEMYLEMCETHPDFQVPDDSDYCYQQYLSKLTVPELKSLLPCYRTDIDKYIRQLIKDKENGMERH